MGDGGTAGNLNSATIANSGTLVFNRGDNITVPNAILGNGKVEKKGAGLMVLSSAQANLTGPVVVSEGTLRPGTTTSLGTTAAGTTVTNGGTLDVNGLNLGGEVFTVSGAGANGQGAIINSGGSQQNAFQYMVLAGDTVVYNDSPTSPADPLVCWWDYGSSISCNDGETFTVDFGASVFTIA